MPRKYGDTLAQINQIGLETTPGTLVPATRRLGSMSWTINQDAEIQKFKPRGAKMATGHALNREWTTGEIEGGLALNEIQYALASVMAKPTVTDLVETWTAATPYLVGDLVKPATPNAHLYEATVAGTSGGSAPAFPTTPGGTVVDGGVTWKEVGPDTQDVAKMSFRIQQYESDDPAIFSVEQGDLARERARAASYVLVNALSIASERQGELEVSGELMGRLADPMEDGLTTTSILEAEPVEATPAQVRVYVDDNPASIGTTRYTGNFAFEFGISDRYGQVWTHNDDLESYDEHNETEPEITLALTCADEAGLDDIITSIRNNERRYVVIRFTGPSIGNTGKKYQLDIKFAGAVSEPAEFTDNEGTYAAELEMEAEYDPTLGYGVEVDLVTDSNAL